MDSNLRGLGINLRLEYIDEILLKKPNLPFLEVIADNWLTPGPHHKKLEDLRRDYEISFHCVGMNIGGVDPLDQLYFESIGKLIRRFSPRMVSDHLCFQAENGRYFHDLLPFPFTDRFLENTRVRIDAIQELLGRAIAIENISYYCEFTSSRIDEVDFINALARSTGSRILLDVNNLWVNWQNLQRIPPDDFLNRLAWDSVAELHLASGERQQDLIIDNHSAPPQQDLIQFLKNWTGKFAKLPVVYERDANLPDFPTLMAESEDIRKAIFDVE